VKCLATFDATSNSPVGVAVIPGRASSLPDRSNSFLQLGPALEYKGFERDQISVRNDKFVLHGLVRDVAADSDLGHSILTLFQSISKPIEPFLSKLTALDLTGLPGILAELCPFALIAVDN
jgi:hypothetical protein